MRKRLPRIWEWQGEGVCSQKYGKLGVGPRGFPRRTWEAQRPGRPEGVGTRRRILGVRMGALLRGWDLQEGGEGWGL